MSILGELKTSVIDGNAKQALALTQKALDDGTAPNEILNQALIAAMAQVGCFYEQGEFYVPEMLVAARAMKSGLELLRPRLAAANIQAVGKVVLGTVQGDMHDIGKNLVGIMLEGAGFHVIDLGIDVPPQRFVDAVREHQPRFIGLSALLTTTMVKMQDPIIALQKAGLRDRVKIVVGGAPVTADYAAQIGADGYAPDASSAARLLRTLMA